MKRFALLILSFQLSVFNLVHAQLPPTMGWRSWNTFALNINEDLIKGQADAMVATGLNKAGYQFINIDDGYWDGRGEDGHLRLNTKLFPSGMRPLVDYIHLLGLKAGGNVVMPNLSPVNVRKLYELYENKICTGEEAAQCRGCLEARVRMAGYEIVTDRGDVAKKVI